MDDSVAKQFKNKYALNGRKLNTLLMSAITKGYSKEETDIAIDNAIVSDDSARQLHTVSCLYIYTNPPPVGYGTPGPKVAESVLRSYSYNKKPEIERKRKIGAYNIEDSKWLASNGPFPTEIISNNWSAFHVSDMARKFLMSNNEAITACVEKTMEKMMRTNSDVLTQGRQTWCPLHEVSVPSALAHSRYMKFIKRNLGTSVHNCLELLQSIFKLMDLDVLKHTVVENRFVIKYHYSKIQRRSVSVSKLKRMIVNVKTKNKEESFKVIMNHLRTFCSYIKENERGKRDRRAIASASIPLRMLLYIVEDFHLDLGKHIPGSTISIGGEEKKHKIESELSSATIPGRSEHIHTIQGTEDATKWNENLMPAVFLLAHHMFFDDQTRQNLGLKLCSMNEKLFMSISKALFSVMAIKRISLGPGLMAENDDISSRIAWKKENMGRMNKKTQEWFKSAIPYLEEDKYMFASSGFLMGMLNAASTTIGLLATGYGLTIEQKCMTLRSSDDSMTLYMATTANLLLECVETNKISLKFLGINLNRGKTLFFKEGYGEYNSWYQDGIFVSQYGQETSSIRPAAQNPQDDFNIAAKSTQVSMLNFTVNIAGATARLRLAMSNVRRLYRITVGMNDRRTLSGDVIFLADGGECPWGIHNLALDEATIRYANIKTDDDREYFNRIMNPNNPFVGERTESNMFSRDTNSIIMVEPETPRNIFCFIKRTNRTAKSNESKERADREKSCDAVFKLAVKTDPSLLVSIPANRQSLLEHVITNLRLRQSMSNLNPDQTAKVEAAIRHLTSGNTSNLDESMEIEEY